MWKLNWKWRQLAFISTSHTLKLWITICNRKLGNCLSIYYKLPISLIITTKSLTKLKTNESNSTFTFNIRLFSISTSTKQRDHLSAKKCSLTFTHRRSFSGSSEFCEKYKINQSRCCEFSNHSTLIKMQKCHWRSMLYNSKGGKMVG